MADTMMFRPATAEDTVTVIRMVGSRHPFKGEGRTGMTSEDFLQNGVGDSAMFHTILVELEGKACGYAIYYWGYDPHTATRGVYLADLFVEAPFRKRGAGRGLICELARRTRERGARWMFWTVRKSDRTARRFYRTLAPELSGVAVHGVFATSFDRIASMGGISSAGD